MIKIRHKKIFYYFFQVVFLVLALVFLIYRPYFITKIVGESMVPSFNEGQLVVASSLDRNYNVKDVVLFKRDEEILIKRIAYLPGHKIICADLGMRQFCPIPPMKNVKAQLKYLNSQGINAYIYEIPKGHVFVIGDNEGLSEDSRNFGAIPISQIFAKIIEI